MKWNRDSEHRVSPEPSRVTEYELAASVHEGASSFDKVREYIKQRKHPAR